MDIFFVKPVINTVLPSTEEKQLFFKHAEIIKSKPIPDTQLNLIKSNVLLDTQSNKIQCTITIRRSIELTYIKNIRLFNFDDLKNLKQATLQINGVNIETIYNPNFKFLKSIYKTDLNVLPFSLTNEYFTNSYETTTIVLEFYETIKEIVVTCDFYESLKKMTVKYNQIQFTCEEPVNYPVTRFDQQLNNGPITDIQIICLDQYGKLIKGNLIDELTFRTNYINEIVYKNPKFDENDNYLLNLSTDFAINFAKPCTDFVIKINDERVKFIAIYGINRLSNQKNLKL
jgi:hypothetical protein